jgi:hypothetical protein
VADIGGAWVAVSGILAALSWAYVALGHCHMQDWQCHHCGERRQPNGMSRGSINRPQKSQAQPHRCGQNQALVNPVQQRREYAVRRLQ